MAEDADLVAISGHEHRGVTASISICARSPSPRRCGDQVTRHDEVKPNAA